MSRFLKVIAGALLMFGLGLCLVHSGFLTPSEELNVPASRSLVDSSAARGERAPGKPPPIQREDGPHVPRLLNLQGQVLEGEMPAEGVRVTLAGESPVSVLTERDGSFIFTNLSPQLYQLEARRNMLVAPPTVVNLNEKTLPVILRLHSASVVEVWAMSAQEQQGLQGALVELRRTTEVLKASTEADGRARLEAVSPGSYELRVSVEGYAPAVREIYVEDAPLAAQRILVGLRRGSAVSGLVVDESGRPLEGVAVMAESALELKAFSPWVLQKDSVRTNAQGQWSIPQLAPGTYRFVAGGESRTLGMSPPVDVEDSKNLEGVIISLPAGAQLSGRVVTRQRVPAAYAQVNVVANDGGFRPMLVRHAQCDEQGYFNLTELPRKEVEVVALHRGATSPAQKIDLTETDKRTDLVLTLDADLSIRGTVVSTLTGEPVAEAVVLMEPASAHRQEVETLLRGQMAAVTDAAGRFEFKGLPATPYLLKAAPPGTSLDRPISWLRPGLQVQPGGDEVTLALTMNGRIKGQVRRQDRRALTSFTVTVSGAMGGAVGGSTGDFIIPDVPEGHHSLRVSGQDFVPTVLHSVRVKSGEETDVGVVVVNTGRRLEGRTLLAGGTPVEGAVVKISKPMEGGVVAGPAADILSDMRRTVSQRDGRFVFEGLDSSPLSIAAEHPRHGLSGLVTLREGEADARLELILKPSGMLSGRVTQRGLPVAEALVLASARDAPGGGSVVTTDVSGMYHFSSLSPGAYTVTVLLDGSAGQRMKESSVVVRAQETSHQDFTLPSGSIDLVVMAPPSAGSPQPIIRLFLEALGPPGSTGVDLIHTQLMLNGEPARFVQLTPGAYRLCVLFEQSAGDSGTPVEREDCRPLLVNEMPAEQHVTLSMSPR